MTPTFVQQGDVQRFPPPDHRKLRGARTAAPMLAMSPVELAPERRLLFALASLAEIGRRMSRWPLGHLSTKPARGGEIGYEARSRPIAEAHDPFRTRAISFNFVVAGSPAKN